MRHVRRRNIALAFAALGLLLQAMPVQAQSSSTWVSGTEDDANPCSRTAPCKTFAGAISKTAAGGQISVLEAGGFGAVTINKSISIVAAGAEGSILAPGNNGIIIRAGANDVVSLSGLIFEGAGQGKAGIEIVSAGAVYISKCRIRGFNTAINVIATATTSVFISNCAIANNAFGIVTKPNGGSARVFLDRVQVLQNHETGIIADGASALVRLNDSAVVDNQGAGLLNPNGGNVVLLGSTVINGNNPDGGASSTAPK
jgi:hypothetical protein